MESGGRSMRCGGGVEDKRMINTLMLRFRPIAPKPAIGRPLLGPSPAMNVVNSRRTKRKYVRVSRNSCKGRGSTMAKQEVKSMSSSSATTLQLLEENRVEKFNSCSMYRFSNTVMTVLDKEEDSDKPCIRLNLNLNLVNFIDHGPNETLLGDMEAKPAKSKRVETWITVEDVSESCCCMDGLGLGCTDMEKLANLGGDTCPGFVSDGSNRVVWVNGAFRRMAMMNDNDNVNDGEEGDENNEMGVRLVMKREVAMRCSDFTCRVKVQYRWLKEVRFSQMVPCDAWRMDGGGFAWRLDVKAALRLGL